MKKATPHQFLTINTLGGLAAMRAKTINAFFCCTASICLFIATANAGPDITWQAPGTISGTSDVSTSGALYGTWAPGNDWGGGSRADYYPVNGVTFAAYGTDGANFGFSGSGINLDRYNGFANPATADGNYNYLMQTAVFNWNAGSSDMIASWNNLTPGNTYMVQMWLNDGRGGQSGTSTFTGGANASAPVAIGNGAPGQYIIGTFVADSTRSESVTMSPGIMLNLVQVRDVTVKPNVTWRTPAAISGPSDVTTQGTYFGSWAPQDGSANTLPVNGVTFQGFSDLPFFTSGPTFDSGYNGYASPGTSDANYNALLQYARYSNAGDQPATFSWSGMTPGHLYLVQFWVNDARPIGSLRSETITGGANTSVPLNFGTNPDGSGPGQYVIGTFVANISRGQTLSLNSIGGIPPQINLFQVRDITPVITTIAVSGTTLTINAANGPANGAYVLLQSASVTLPLAQWTQVLNGSFDGNGNLTASANVVNPGNPQQFYVLRAQP
jgi:hypothetical protein